MAVLPAIPAQAQLEVGRTSVTFTSPGGTIDINVTTSGSWAATSNQTWLTVSPASHTGNGWLTVTAVANTTTSTRYATVTVSGSGVTRTIRITQTAPGLTLTPTALTFLAAGGTETVTVTTADGIDYSWGVQDVPAWLTVTPLNGSGTGTFTVTAAANPSTASRNVTLYVGAARIPLTVTQEGAPPITLTPASLSFTAAGGAETVTLTTAGGANISWDINNIPTWLTVSPSYSSGSKTLTVTAAANTTTSTRSATLGVGPTRIPFTVTQAGVPFTLTVSPTSLDFPSAGGEEAVKVESNGNWTATSSQTWLTVTPTSGTGDEKLTVTASTNIRTTGRTATITVRGARPTHTHTINVKQEGMVTTPTYTLTASTTTNSSGRGSVSPTTATVAEGGSQTFTATPNSGYAVYQWHVNAVYVQTGGTTYTVQNVQSDMTVTVSFLPTYTMTATAGPGGSVSPTTATVMQGYLQTFTATPDNGKEVDQWTVNGTVVQTGGNTYTRQSDANRAIHVTFKDIAATPTTYTLTASAGSGGSVSPTTATVAEGGSQTFTATPNQGKEVDLWKIGGNTVQSGGNSYTLSNVRANHAIEVTFKDIAQQLSSDASLSSLSLGTGISLTPAFNPLITAYTATVPYTRTSVTVSATPADSRASVTGTGTYGTLPIGQTTITLTVTAEDGTQRNYSVVVTRSPDPTGIEELSAPTVYAAAGHLHIRVPAPATVHIYNVMGALVKTQKVPAGQTTIPLPNGLYLVKVDNTTSKQMIK
jgi:hypothetical protein